ncbi:MAG: class I SAM-dependent methyltransferase [Wenzhouxiangellaceae bacterium]
MDKKLDKLRQVWDSLGSQDPMWGILSDPGKKGNRWDPDAFFLSGQDEVGKVINVVETFFPGVPRRCALDFGCGIGRLSRPLSGYFDRVVGVDIAESMINKARQLNQDLPGCEFVLHQHDDLDFVPAGSVDFIYSNIVLQHIERPYSDRYLEEFVRILSDQGVAVFQAPYERRGGIFSASTLVPAPLLEGYRTIRYGRKRVQMHAIPTSDVDSIICQVGGRIARVEESDAAGPGWKSKRYFVVRQGVEAPTDTHRPGKPQA